MKEMKKQFGGRIERSLSSIGAKLEDEDDCGFAALISSL